MNCPTNVPCSTLEVLAPYKLLHQIAYRGINNFIIKFILTWIVKVLIDLAWVDINLHAPLHLPHLQQIIFIHVLNVDIELFYQYDVCIPGLLRKCSILLCAVDKFVDKLRISKQTRRLRTSKVPSLMNLIFLLLFFFWISN